MVAAAPRTPEAEAARHAIRELDERLEDLRRRLERERQAAAQLAELGRQLRAQSARLTKAVVSAGHLVDFEFRVCPRCGEALPEDRTDAAHCLLCLQQPSGELSREDLLLEQTRIEAQIDETEEVKATRGLAVHEIERALAQATADRAREAARLDQATAKFVSDRGDEIAAAAADEAAAKAEVEQFTAYIGLLDKADRARAKEEQLRERRQRVDEQLRDAERVSAASEERVSHFERRFGALVEELRLPEFEEEADPRAAINRADYEPIVNGRRIEQHSGGMRVLINVAHMLALHRTSLEAGLAVPGLLMIDGINQNLGRGEYDSERYNLVWEQLVAFHESYASDLQLIVASNDVPDFVAERELVRLQLHEDDRLVPDEPADDADTP